MMHQPHGGAEPLCAALIVTPPGQALQTGPQRSVVTVDCEVMFAAGLGRVDRPAKVRCEPPPVEGPDMRAVDRGVIQTAGPGPSHACHTPTALPTARPLASGDAEVRLEYWLLCEPSDASVHAPAVVDM